ncbi:hypothetical protein U1Q18_040669, partial [Sarracenia purpurea var. burkii]
DPSLGLLLLQKDQLKWVGLRLKQGWKGQRLYELLQELHWQRLTMELRLDMAQSISILSSDVKIIKESQTKAPIKVDPAFVKLINLNNLKSDVIYKEEGAAT